ncbi:MAG: adenylyl-sulfate kinase [Nitrosotalea sp.]
MQACAIWITGLPASGKSTIASLLKDYIKSIKMPRYTWLTGYTVPGNLKFNKETAY